MRLKAREIDRHRSARTTRWLVRTWIAVLPASVMPLTWAGENACSRWDRDGLKKHPNCLSLRADGSLRVQPPLLRKLGFDGRFATLFSEYHGWVYVDRRGTVVARGVMLMDKGADYIADGFVRFERDGRCGYAALSGHHRSIAPRFDGCLPFEVGRAWVCIGCRSVNLGEHHVYKGGEAFCIDRNGQIAVCRPGG